MTGAKKPAREASDELMRLPGGSSPVHRLCQGHAEAAARHLPIQVRDSLSLSVSATAAEECVEVLAVLVSVAMETGDTTEEGLATVEEALSGAENQLLSDTCDEHYRAWQLLRTYRSRSGPPPEGTDLETRQYDGWMDRCFRVVLPISRGNSG